MWVKYLIYVFFSFRQICLPKISEFTKNCFFQVWLIQQQRWKDSQLYGRMCWMFSFLAESWLSLHCLLQDSQTSGWEIVVNLGTSSFLESFRWTCGKRQSLFCQTLFFNSQSLDLTLSDLSKAQPTVSQDVPIVSPKYDKQRKVLGECLESLPMGGPSGNQTILWGCAPQESLITLGTSFRLSTVCTRFVIVSGSKLWGGFPLDSR